MGIHSLEDKSRGDVITSSRVVPLRVLVQLLMFLLFLSNLPLHGAKAVSAACTSPLQLSLDLSESRGAKYSLCPLCASKSVEEIGACFHPRFLHTMFKIWQQQSCSQEVTAINLLFWLALWGMDVLDELSWFCPLLVTASFLSGEYDEYSAEIVVMEIVGTTSFLGPWNRRFVNL